MRRPEYGAVQSAFACDRTTAIVTPLAGITRFLVLRSRHAQKPELCKSDLDSCSFVMLRAVPGIELRDSDSHATPPFLWPHSTIDKRMRQGRQKKTVHARKDGTEEGEQLLEE